MYSDIDSLWVRTSTTSTRCLFETGGRGYVLYRRCQADCNILYNTVLKRHSFYAYSTWYLYNSSSRTEQPSGVIRILQVHVRRIMPVNVAKSIATLQVYFKPYTWYYVEYLQQYMQVYKYRYLQQRAGGTERTETVQVIYQVQVPLQCAWLLKNGIFQENYWRFFVEVLELYLK